jgi:hypothetical protein
MSVSRRSCVIKVRGWFDIKPRIKQLEAINGISHVRMIQATSEHGRLSLHLAFCSDDCTASKLYLFDGLLSQTPRPATT